MACKAEVSSKEMIADREKIQAKELVYRCSSELKKKLKLKRKRKKDVKNDCETA